MRVKQFDERLSAIHVTNQYQFIDGTGFSPTMIANEMFEFQTTD